MPVFGINQVSKLAPLTADTLDPDVFNPLIPSVAQQAITRSPIRLPWQARVLPLVQNSIFSGKATSNLFPHNKDGTQIVNSGITPTANSSPWKVINYQIPVPIGDCSAHFLVEINTNKVRRAFLMDGGTNAGTYVAWVQILKALRFIDLQLGNDWKFDSWVVTHWDADHYSGVKDLLLNEGIKFTRCSGAGKPVTRGISGSFASLYFAEDAWLCCGAWDVEAMFVKGDGFLRHFVRQDKLYIWGRLSTTIPTRAAGTEGQSLLRCIWGETLICLDLFTRSYQYHGGTGEEYEYTGHLFESERRLESDHHAVAAKNTPRFCVVGANGYGIGQATPFKKEKPSKNETSILALLYWKRQNLCSYYTGGDGNPGIFKGIVKPWFDKTWPDCDVEMVKLDHHGSTRENLGGVTPLKNQVQERI
ncbi:hypothetical protein A9Z42_0016560 [Trichoderma parareesei]|uniref:Metallo-beta-lactamase domain-containing protein n=1 Tax=Trichoderma parareesei TaxID=858221 RepID=A0A2H2ZD08_TRIPA|nr:hypothetical protein A9Z42_0016560 [Trichoderma parareesei]